MKPHRNLPPGGSGRGGFPDRRQAEGGSERPTASPPGLSWVVGFHAVVGVLERDPRRVELVLVGEGSVGGRVRRILDLARGGRVRFQTVARQRLDEVAEGVAHNGFAARVAPVPYADAVALLGLPSPVCLLGLDGVEDGHNLGAAVRVAAAFGIGGVVVGGPHPPPLGGAASKVAAGALELVQVAHVGSLGDFARNARESGFWTLGAAAGGAAVDRTELPERLLLCIGAEHAGLRAKTLKAVDGTIGVPLANGVESLNLAVAAGILAWEWRRRYPLAGG